MRKINFEKPGPGYNRRIGRELHGHEATSRKTEIALQLVYAVASSCPRPLGRPGNNR